MNDSSFLPSLLPPAVLFGVVFYLTRPESLRGLRGLSQGSELSPVRGTTKKQRTRHAARKLYGSAVLSAQAAASLRKLALHMNDQDISSMSAALAEQSHRLLDKASRYDAEFVRGKLIAKTRRN